MEYHGHCLWEHLESSDIKMMMSGPIVRQLCEQRNGETNNK